MLGSGDGDRGGGLLNNQPNERLDATMYFEIEMDRVAFAEACASGYQPNQNPYNPKMK